HQPPVQREAVQELDVPHPRPPPPCAHGRTVPPGPTRPALRAGGCKLRRRPAPLAPTALTSREPPRLPAPIGGPWDQAPTSEEGHRGGGGGDRRWHGRPDPVAPDRSRRTAR